MAPTFTVRKASTALGDGGRILKFLDSQIPYLAQLGAEGQWGSTLLSTKGESLDKYRAKVEHSEAGHTWSQDWIQIHIAEANGSTADPETTGGSDDIKSQLLPVAAMILSGSSPEYAQAVVPLQDERDPFLYVSLVVTDRNAGLLSKGSGEVLLDQAKHVANELGLRRLCLDCWNGNGRRLVKYYESRGFHAIGDFVDPEDGWSGTVLEISTEPPAIDVSLR